MRLPKADLHHLNSITHDGKVVVVATAQSGQLFYTIRQDGFEDSYGNTAVLGWENWDVLPLPDEADDPSVLEKEQETLTVQDETGQYILRSRYQTADQTAIAPVQLVSGLGHLYIFRQSTTGILLVDRFVLDGLTNTLVRKLDVRFKRSRQKYTPLENPNSRRRISFDALDYRDANNQPFYEPTTELSLIQNLSQGWFDVVLLPTAEQEKFRWHFFAYDTQAKTVEMISMRTSTAGLFEIKDDTVLDPKPGEPSVLLPRNIPGIIRRSLDLQTPEGQPLEISNGLTATAYDLQEERETQAGPQLLKTATKVMLAIPVEAGVAALSFAAAADGTLSQIDEQPQFQILRSDDRDVLLPLNTLDEIKGIGQSAPPPQGSISGMERGDNDQVRIRSAQSLQLQYGDQVEITDTQHYNGHYIAKKIDDNTFEIETQWVEPEAGTWEVVPEEATGLIFDGIITAYEQTPDGKIRITSPNHGLDSGDEVQVADTQSYDGIYEITEIESDRFSIDLPWAAGEAVNLKLESRKRRGISFDGEQDYIDIPALELKRPSLDYAYGHTYSAWVYVHNRSRRKQILVSDQDNLMKLCMSNSRVMVQLGDLGQVTDSDLLPEQQWVHYASTFAYDPKTRSTTLTLCRNGIAIAYEVFEGSPKILEKDTAWAPQFWIGGSDNEHYFTGKLADVQIWDQARSPQMIKDQMYLRLTGREVGLAGYWRMGAIMEGRQRHVVDFSIHEKDGTVYGDAFVSAATLSRTLGDGTTPAVQYQNDELFAVSQRATYKECFEFKVNTDLDPNDVGGDGTSLFKLAYWGQDNRSSEAVIEFSSEQAEFEALSDGWYKATARFTVPDDIRLVRSFGLVEVAGEWQTLEVRKHRIRSISDSVTKATYRDRLELVALTNPVPEENVAELTRKEMIESDLLAQKQKLEADIADLSDLAGLQATIRELERLEANERQRRDAGFKSYRAAVENPFNYYCRIINRNSGLAMDIQNFSTSDGGKLGQYSPGNHHHQHWRFEQWGDYYIIVNRKTNKVIDISGQSKSSGATVHQWTMHREHSQQWRLFKIDQAYQIINRNSDFAIDVRNFSRSGGALLGQYPYGDHLSQQWILQPTTEQLNDTIPHRLSLYQRYVRDYQRISQELASKRQMLANRESELQRLKKALEDVIAALVDVQAVLNQLNTLILDSIQTSAQSAQSMAILHTDAQDLPTQGALLDFVQPMSRLTSLASSEGHVQLNYFDRQGRIRQTKYDATADRLNAAYEQWLPDSLKACVNLQQVDSKLLLEDPIQLSEDWSAEVWFSYPLPQTAQWNTLLRGETPDHQVIVRDGQYLGTYIIDSPQKFYPAQYQTEGVEPMDYSLENLTPGWHHLAVVGTGSGDNAKTLFYIDGQKVGESAIKSTTNILTIGNNTDNHQPFGKITEVRLWNVALSPSEVEINSKILLSGNEPGLVAYFPTNEADGTVVRDHSGNNHHAEVQSALWWTCAAPIGNPGHEVLVFGEADNRITVPHHPSFKLTSALTLEAWVKPDHLNQAWQTIAQYPHASTHTAPYCDYSLVLHASGGLHSRIDGKPTESYGQLSPQVWSHVAMTWDGATVTFFINGEQVGSETMGTAPIQYAQNNPFLIGANASNEERFHGCIAEVRLWSVARSPSEIQSSRHLRLTGQEEDLVGYWPLDEVDNMATPATVQGVGGTGVVTQPILTSDQTLPISNDAVVAVEYSTISIEPGTQQKAALMRRFLAVPRHTGATLFTDQRVEMLELRWVGNAQFAPTLLGYIEGAPPIPSENLTEEEDYNGATSVELTVTDDLEFSWNRSQESGIGTSSEFFVGVGGTTSAGIGAEQEFEYKAGIKGELNTQRTDLNESNISSSVGLSMTDRLELRGGPEQSPEFEHLGKRYVPKNVGYALVVSGLADLYITRLKRSQRMIGYQLLPNADLPFDVNTVTFLMNPAYTMNGSLDGQTGTAAASDRFHRHVPEMRSQYGSLYPASYFRVQEAYDIEAQIEQQDKAREAYFQNFDARAVEASALSQEIGPIDLEPAPITVGGDSEVAEPQTEVEQQAQQEERSRQTQDQGTQNAEVVEAQANQRRAEVEASQANQETKVQALAGISSWQRKMEGILVWAAKRNIVNTYVWDADGGLRSETQEFASAVEHTIGGSLSVEGGIGGGAEGAAGAVAGELSVLVTGSLSQTLTKTENRSRGFSLEVDLGGVESRGVTDHQDRPLISGEKVDRYRFKSFYLEGHTNHFHDFFDTVVDPEWLQSNDEEARALRQTMAGRPNKTWRVLHRVTYVERPALLGFGRDLRPRLGREDAESDLLMKIAQLESHNLELAGKLDDVIHLLRSQSLQGQIPTVSVNGESVLT